MKNAADKDISMLRHLITFLRINPVQMIAFLYLSFHIFDIISLFVSFSEITGQSPSKSQTTDFNVMGL